jgi:DNA-binding transcriptional LysR family regulator
MNYARVSFRDLELRQRMTEVDIKLLRLFAIVVDRQGMSAAQESLNLGLSAISTKMATLETRLGVRLCERGRSGFKLTSEGAQVFEATQSLLSAVEDFCAKVGQVKRMVVGELNIGVLDNVVTNQHCPLQDAIAAFENSRSMATLRLQIFSPGELERSVAERRVHLGIGPRAKPLAGLSYHELFIEEQWLYCGRNHPLYNRPQVRMSDIKGYSYVGHRIPLRTVPEREIFEQKTSVVEMESVAILILSGAYLGFLPTHYAEIWARSGQLRPILNDKLRYKLPFYLILRRGQRPTLALEHFIDYLKFPARRKRGTLAKEAMLR